MSVDLKPMPKPERGAAEISAVVFAMILPTFVTLFYFVLLAKFSAVAQQTGYAAAKVLQFSFPLFWVYIVCREKRSAPRISMNGLVLGVGFGLAVTAAMLALYHGFLKPSGSMDDAVEQIRQKILRFGVDQIGSYVLLAAFYSLFHSLLEEYYWRWFVFGRLRHFASLTLAISVSSLAFMSHHVLVLGYYFGWDSAATYLFSLCVAVGGAVWAWLYHRADSLVAPWISHLFVDAAIFLVGYNMVSEQLT